MRRRSYYVCTEMRRHGYRTRALLGMRKGREIRPVQSASREWASAMRALYEARKRIANGRGTLANTDCRRDLPIVADFCLDCSHYELDAPSGYHDMGEGRGWALCEGCGFHLFAAGVRECRRGPFSLDEAFASMPCRQCAESTFPERGA